MSMEDKVEHHSQAISQSTMSYEMSRNTVPPKNDNIVSFELSPRHSVLYYEAQKEWYEKMRGWVTVVAVQVLSMVYASGLNPPGGFCQDDVGKAGSAIHEDIFRARHLTFFYANATAFMTTLLIILLLVTEDFYIERFKVVILYVSMVIDLISLMITYAAGYCGSVSFSIYIIVLGAVVLLFVIRLAHVLPIIYLFVINCCPGKKSRGLSSLVVDPIDERQSKT